MYPKTKLGNVLELHRGYDLPERERVDGNVPIISSSGYSGCHNEYKCEGENVITGRYGTIGEVFFHEGKCWPLNTALYVSDYKGNYPKYIYYLLKYVLKLSTDGKDKSTVPGVDRNVLHQMNIPFCEDIDQQRQSIKVLENLDGRIKINKKVNDNLQQQAKLLYDYWFTQFDFPDGNGKPYRSSGGRMEWNEILKRHIPVGWQVKSLAELMDKTGDAFDYSSAQPAIDLSVMPSDSIALSQLNTSESFSTNLYKMKKGDILFGSIRPYLHKAGFAPCDGVVAGTVHSYTVKNECDYNFSLITVSRKVFFDYAVNVSSGTKMPVVSSDSVLAYKVPYNAEIVSQFNNIALTDTIAINVRENQKLIAMRDWLLPMLMNGQATISD